MPTLQLVQEGAVAPPKEYDPALQGPVGLLSPKDPQYMPGKHGAHDDCPGSFCCVPTGQATQADDAPPGEYVPIWHKPLTAARPVDKQ